MSARSMRRATLGGIAVGDGEPVAIVGALNVSPESFYAGSIHRGAESLLRAAEAMVEAGAVIIDVGGMSTAPYLQTTISEAEERDRLASAVELLAAKLPVPISADTARRVPAEAAMDAGARIVNDITGLADPAVASLSAQRDVSLILMPRRSQAASNPIGAVKSGLEASLATARAAGIPDERIVLDPGIGFYLTQADARARWDVAVLAALGDLLDLGRPLCVAVSRKSFIGTITGHRAAGERLSGSLAATTAAVLHGAAVIRTHDVRETVDAVRVAEAIRQAGAR